MSDGPVFVERIDYEAAAMEYSTQAGESGWILAATKRVVDAALVGVRPAEGSRVAGRDDLLIRREDIDYEAAKRAAFEMAEQIAQARYEGQRFSLTEVNDLKVRAAVDAALAAAEGEEG